MLLHERFLQVAKRFSSKLFINDRMLGRKVTYGRALIGSLILAQKFRAYDEGFIGIMLPTSAGSVLAMMGSLLSGRVPVMINYSTGADQNCRFAQDKCDFRTVITARALLSKINCPELPGMVFLEDIMKSVSAIDKLKAAVRSKLPVASLVRKYAQGAEDDTAFILFTSGSEKDPKAVPLSHKNIVANIQSLAQVYELRADDIFLAQLPYFHIFGQTANLWAPVYFGMTIVTYANPLDFKTICSVLREEKCTLMVGTPAFFWGYLERSSPGDFESLRLMLSGADKCPEALRKGYFDKHGKVLLEAYGATETSPGITVNSEAHNRPGSVGRPIPGVSVRVENYESGDECATGEIGKILVKGENVMKGYFDDFEQTSMAIRHGWYDTGDMGWMDEDGYLWHVGRLKRFLKVGGEMVSLVKVEDVLERFLPEGTSCCVVELPDQRRGAKIVAAVTHSLDEKAVLKGMASELPNIALPKQFVVIPELPKMGSGKIDFRGVTEMVKKQLYTPTTTGR